VLERIRANPKTKLQAGRHPDVLGPRSRILKTGYSLGANGYIRKPVDFQEFVDAVSRLGIYWLLLIPPPPALPTSSPWSVSRMAMGTREGEQASLWIATSELPKSRSIRKERKSADRQPPK